VKLFLLPFVLAMALPAADPSIVPGMNAFTVASYQQLSRRDANLILSPFNIASALSMAWAGARGATANEIAHVLRQHRDSSYDSAFAALAADLTKAGNTGGNQLLTANGLWVQKGFPIEAAFQKTLANDYHAPPTPLDFAANAESARGEINRWTEQHTQGRIKDLLAARALNARTWLVLTSAIYFYGTWQEPFPESRTEAAPFTLESGAASRANFMRQTARFRYAEISSAQLLEMPYAGTGIAFDVLLPKTPNGLAALEKSLTPEKLTAWLANLTRRKVETSIPKFRAESEFSLRQALSQMGMPDCFTGSADFSGIGAHGKLAIAEVAHKALIDVSERGTEAAAATAVTATPTAARVEELVVFRADHPFLFLIRDTRSGVILFIGRLKNPHS